MLCVPSSLQMYAFLILSLHVQPAALLRNFIMELPFFAFVIVKFMALYIEQGTAIVLQRLMNISLVLCFSELCIVLLV